MGPDRNTLATVLAGRKGMSPVMIGRTVALVRLQRALRSARPGTDAPPTIVAISGEAGVGKTRLLQELVAHAEPDTVVLAGQSDPGSLGRPFELVTDLLGGLPLAEQEPERAAVTAICERIGTSRALVLFEDLHWTDSESVKVFERLAGLRLGGLVLVATFRPDELNRRLPGGEMMARLERRHSVVHVGLERLTRAEVGSFLGAVAGKAAPSSVIDLLYHRTGGNPFFLEEFLAAAGGSLDVIADQPLPWSLADIVARQLDGLSTTERRVIDAAAVLGREASFDVLAAVTELDEPELITNLRALVARKLLVEEVDDEFEFRHALVRDAVETQLLGRERRRLHERALTVLRASPCRDLAALARHAAGSGRYDEMVELAREGVAHYLESGSTFQALRLADEALGEAPDDVLLLAGAARAAWLLTFHEEATELCKRWLAEARRSGELVAEAEATCLLARLQCELDAAEELEHTIADLQRLVERLEPGRERALVLASIAQTYMLTARSALAVTWADRAIAEAEGAGAKSVLAQALVEKGTALSDAGGRDADAEELLSAGIALAETLDDWVLIARGLNNLCRHVHLDTDRGIEVIERMREAGERSGFVSIAESSYLHRLTDRATALGDLDQALQLAEQALQLSVRLHQRCWTAGAFAMLLIEAGRLGEAEALLARLDAPIAHSLRWYSVGRCVANVRLAAARRDARAAREAIDQLGDGLAAAGEALYDVYVEPIDAALRAGVDVDELTALAMPAWIANRAEWGPLVEAHLASARNDHPRVVELLTAVVDDQAQFLDRPQRARLRCVLARSQLALGNSPAAGVQVERALAELERWPGWRQDDALALARRIEGTRGGGSGAVAGDGGLTAREREVAVLVASGLTNRELADRLYISPKTASVHISNILAKLGLDNRTELAAWALRSGVAAPTS